MSANPITTHNSADVTNESVAQHGRTLAGASDNGTVRLWDTASGQPAGPLEGHTGPVRAVAFSRDRRTLVSASDDGTVRLWDTASGQPAGTLGRTRPVRAVAFSPDGRTLASATDDGTRLWDASGQPLRQLEGHIVYALAFSPDGRTLASASWDGMVRLWDAASGQPAGTLKGHTGPVRAVAFSPDGRTLASADQDGTVRLWDSASGQPAGTLEGHTVHAGPVWTVAFSPDGRTLASASSDRTVRLWDPAIGQPAGTLEGHTGPVWTVAFSPDGRTLASAGDDQTVRLWIATLTPRSSDWRSTCRYRRSRGRPRTSRSAPKQATLCCSRSSAGSTAIGSATQRHINTPQNEACLRSHNHDPARSPDESDHSLRSSTAHSILEADDKCLVRFPYHVR